MKEEQIIEERKKKIKEFLFKKNFVVIILLLVLLGLSWHIRTVNVPGLKDITTGEYTLGPDLDPWLFYRYAKSIVDTGSIPKTDTMRYVPLGADTSQETQVLPYMMAYFHKILTIFNPSTSFTYSAVIFPAFMFLFTVIAFFLLVGKIFEEHKFRWYISSLASLLLIIAPIFLPRTVAGIPEKESAAFFFMFLALYFFVWMFKERKENQSYTLAVLAGLSTILMGLIWGGVIYIFTVAGVFGLFLWVLGKVDKKGLISYGIWIFLSFITLAIISGRYSIIGFITSTSSGIAFASFILILIDYVLFNTKFKEIKFLKDLEEKYPRKILSLAFFIVLGVIGVSLVLGPKFIPNFIGDITFHLTQPYSDRFSFTVAENRQPFFSEWRDDFGPTIKGLPILFWLFVIGSILLFYKTIKLEKKDKVYATLVYSYFLFSLIFSRYSVNSIMDGSTLISKLFYFSGILVFGGYIFYLSYVYEKNKKENYLKEFNLSYLLLFSLFFVSIIGARSAVRLIMVLVPASSILVSFLFFEVLGNLNKQKDDKRVYYAIIFIVITLLMLLAVSKNYQSVVGTAKAYVPSVYNQQWQKAMAWVRNNTSENAVFSHWWDYGYWVQSIGNRATMLDGGNFIVYWNHLFGYHVLTGHTEKEALELLYTHNVTHLLIDSTDIGKYPAYSSIGSDENYNKYSWMTTFTQNEKLTKELRNGTEYYYEGGFLLDEDFLYKDGETEILFPGRKSHLAFIKITSNGQEVEGIEGMFFYQGRQMWVPINCLYYEDKKYDFNEEGYDGCFKIIPSVSSEGGSLNKKGAGIFVSERIKKTNFARLYLFDETENFEVVHEEEDYVVQILKEQGFEVGDFILYGGIRGPIKIWKVNYPQNIQANPEYLEIRYPNQELELAKPGYY